jgi:hypothetical protein
MPEAGDSGTDVLPLEEQVRRDAGLFTDEDQENSLCTKEIWVSADPCPAVAGMVENQSQTGCRLYRNECWCMDFVSDQLYNGKLLRALTVLGTFSRESLVIYMDKTIKGE